ncbi:hypothetical protein [Dyella lutea]|uniref:Uncharacterized protein n=1 Tax=Dyella lutea TaxID=2950441 RepID=A0ABT1F9Y3_9GAMM|nr:hypothetical protein [Dyella lutea]MCP1374172.1 hypothetical protein [Dyella lutea]
MKALFVRTLVASLIVAAATSASASSVAAQPASSTDPVAQAVLDCHAQYAKKFALSSTAASASEIATGSEASCKPEMDAYIRNAMKISNSNPDTMAFAKTHQAEMVRALKDYAFSYTVDAVIRARSLP